MHNWCRLSDHIKYTSKIYNSLAKNSSCYEKINILFMRGMFIYKISLGQYLTIIATCDTIADLQAEMIQYIV
jgi:hypothetical protein